MYLLPAVTPIEIARSLGGRRPYHGNDMWGAADDALLAGFGMDVPDGERRVVSPLTSAP